MEMGIPAEHITESLMSYYHYSRLNQLESRMDSRVFLRVHRNALINQKNSTGGFLGKVSSGTGIWRPRESACKPGQGQAPQGADWTGTLIFTE
jgi:hypothetical protein